MRVVHQESLGVPEVLRVVDVARPEPRPTEVLIQAKAAGVNPVDRKPASADSSWRPRSCWAGRFATW